jgi:hypothetical protein
MKRYPCGSKLSISCRIQKDNEEELTITVRLKQAAKHVCYVDVSMPPEALAMIRNNVEWLTPAAMVTKVQAAFPTVTAAQIRRVWVELSEPFWHFEDDQLLASTSPNAVPLLVAAAEMELTARDPHVQQETSVSLHRHPQRVPSVRLPQPRRLGRRRMPPLKLLVVCR